MTLLCAKSAATVYYTVQSFLLVDDDCICPSKLRSKSQFCYYTLQYQHLFALKDYQNRLS